VAVPTGVLFQDEAGRLGNLVWLLACAARRAATGKDAIRFTLHVRNDNAEGTPPLVRLKARCGPGDDGKPVITVIRLTQEPSRQSSPAQQQVHDPATQHRLARLAAVGQHIGVVATRSLKLVDASKTPKDLAQAVQAHLHCRKLRAAVERARQAARERPEIEQALAKADALLEASVKAAQEKYQATRGPLEQRLRQIEATVALGGLAAGELSLPCPGRRAAVRRQRGSL
jgi:hypothetical protein